MSINDPCIPTYSEKHADWRLVKGRETFYNDKNVMLVWDSRQEAVQWALDHGEKVLVDGALLCGDMTYLEGEAVEQFLKPKPAEQLPLFDWRET